MLPVFVRDFAVDADVQRMLEDRLRKCADRVTKLGDLVAELASEISELSGMVGAQATNRWQDDVQTMLAQQQAEIARLLREGSNAGAVTPADFPFRLDPAEREIRIGRRRVSLTPQEYKVIEILWEQMPSSVSREAILERLYGADRDKSERIVDVFVSNIRQKLQMSGATDVTIQSKAGQGWRLELRMQGAMSSFGRSEKR